MKGKLSKENYERITMTGQPRQEVFERAAMTEKQWQDIYERTTMEGQPRFWLRFLPSRYDRPSASNNFNFLSRIRILIFYPSWVKETPGPGSQDTRSASAKLSIKIGRYLAKGCEKKNKKLWNLPVSHSNVVNLTLGPNLGHVTPKQILKYEYKLVWTL